LVTLITSQGMTWRTACFSLYCRAARDGSVD
jgi:hypothetical protein